MGWGDWEGREMGLGSRKDWMGSVNSMRFKLVKVNH